MEEALSAAERNTLYFHKDRTDLRTHVSTPLPPQLWGGPRLWAQNTHLPSGSYTTARRVAILEVRRENSLGVGANRSSGLEVGFCQRTLLTLQGLRKEK